MPFSRSGRSWGCGQDSGVARTHPMGTWFTARSRAVAWLTRAISVNLPNQEERPASHSWAGQGACLTLHQASYLDRATPRKSERRHTPADSHPRQAGAPKGLQGPRISPGRTAGPDQLPLPTCLLRQRNPGACRLLPPLRGGRENKYSKPKGQMTCQRKPQGRGEHFR